MRTLYNEGRVVGLSSYELYLRQMLTRNPDAKVLTESQWLAAALGTNNSMILKIRAGTTKGYHDYMLPEGSDLCSCTSVIGSVFEGSVTCIDGTPWAKRVDDYGRLIANYGNRHPVTPGMPEDVPVKEDYETPSEEFLLQCREYMKISSGIVLQPGEWTDNIHQVELTNETDVVITTEDDIDLLADVSDTYIRMSLDVDLSKRGFVRLLFNETVSRDFYIFLHGFSYKNILAGMSGFDDLMDQLNPENGDFLGPQCYPWAVHIMFIYTNDMLSTIQYSVQRMETLYYQVIDDTDYFAQTVRELNSRYTQLTGLYQDLIRRFGEVIDTVNGMESTVQALQHEVEAVDSRFEIQDEKITRINSHLHDVDTRLNNLDDTTSALNTKLTNTQGEVSDMEIRLTAFSDTLDNAIDTVNESITATNTRIDEQSEKVGNLEQLTTLNKTQIVRAINEVNSKVNNSSNTNP